MTHRVEVFCVALDGKRTSILKALVPDSMLPEGARVEVELTPVDRGPVAVKKVFVESGA